MRKEFPKSIKIWGLLLGLAFVFCESAVAATLCVNPGGTRGCFSTIGAAVSHASANDTIKVGPGTYKEDVVIGKPLSLIAGNRDNDDTFIDAQGLANGIYVDGVDNPGLGHVTVAGFTIENANLEGILVANASFVTILNNDIRGNDTQLPSACSSLPSFETNETDDCGQGIHLSGADHSIIANNRIVNNAGGILVSDDTGAAHDNLLTGNEVRDNQNDCGITLASHAPAALTGSKTPLGVFHNTVAGNKSFYNGVEPPGGSGIGIFDSLPGAMSYGNVIIDNEIRGNGHPGVSLHSHAPHQILSDNVIVGNHIADNGADDGQTATPGPTGINIFGISPVTGTIISQNVIEDEDIAIAINSPTPVDAHLNSFSESPIGVDNLGASTIDATENWWGCHAGPGTSDCASVKGQVLVAPWLTRPFHDDEQ